MAEKFALVIGGSRGIGKAVALALARECMTVGIAYLRNDASANETANEVRRLGGTACMFKLDVRNPDEIKNLFQEIQKKFGSIHVLVHSVGLGIFKPLNELSSGQLTRIFDINARSFILCSQESARLMKRGGNIVALSSLGGQRYVSRYGAIGVAKAALESAVRYLAVELAPKGIKVNAVSGGPVDTIGVKALPDYKKRKKLAIKMSPLGKIASPDDIANIVVFLCKKESDWIRGQILIADGGLSLMLAGL